MPSPAEVRISSVVSGGISLRVATIVVLPTPKPPAITIFSSATGTRALCPRMGSEPLQAIKQCLQKFFFDGVPGKADRGGHFQRVAVEEVPDQDLHDLDRLLEQSGDLGDGAHSAGAVHQQRLALRAQPGQRTGSGAGEETGGEIQRVR
jgi:hypothetical protein